MLFSGHYRKIRVPILHRSQGIYSILLLVNELENQMDISDILRPRLAANLKCIYDIVKLYSPIRVTEELYLSQGKIFSCRNCIRNFFLNLRRRTIPYLPAPVQFSLGSHDKSTEIKVSERIK
jgi:hypothetical protein